MSANEKAFYQGAVDTVVGVYDSAKNYTDAVATDLKNRVTNQVDTSTPTRSGYPRNPDGKNTNVTNLSGAHSYPNSITGDPLGFVNYMPYAHGKPQAGMNDTHGRGGAYGSSSMSLGSVVPNPLQVNLHMPSDLTDSVSAKWDTGEDIVAKASEIGVDKALSGIASEATKNISTKVVGEVAELLTKGLITPENLRKSWDRQHGHALRPFESQFFQGVEYRTFSFKNKLIAFEKKDTITINKIIKTFRWHSSPGLATDHALMYRYPSTWRIRFFQADPNRDGQVYESEWLPTVKRCVLEKVDVNHFASNTPSYHSNLAPVDIEITLSFREMEYVTKQSIENETQPVWEN